MEEQPTEGGMENQQTRQPARQRSPKRGGSIFGWILVILGILFLLNNFDILYFDRFWPVILIAVGVILLIQRTSGDRDG
jgi:hypothetical protein